MLMILKCCLMSLKCFFNDLSSSLINFVRSRDPVGEKTTKIGAAAFGRRTYKGGRRPSAAAPLCSFCWLPKLFELLLKSLKNISKSLDSFSKS